MNHPSFFQNLLDKATAHHRAGEWGLAESHYRQALKLQPQDAELHHLLGVVAMQCGHPPKAVKHFRDALKLRPRFSKAWNNLALALKAQSKFKEAFEAWGRALEIDPQYVDAHYNLAILQQQLGDNDAAVASYQRCLALAPQRDDARNNLALLLRRMGRLAQADAELKRIALGDEQNAEAWLNWALVQIDRGEFAKAIVSATRAQSLQPHWLEAGLARAQAFRLAGDADAAIGVYESLGIDQLDVESQHEYSLALAAVGKTEMAAKCLSALLARAPHDVLLQWRSALLLPAISDDQQQVEQWLSRFDQGLAQLQAAVGKLEGGEECLRHLAAAGSVSIADLHYLSGHHLERATLHGDLMVQLAARALPVPERSRAESRERIRVGFVSGHLRLHSVTRFFGAWLGGLNCEKFETLVFHLGEQRDALTESIAARVDRFDHLPRDVQLATQLVRAADLDVLIHLDIGLDPMSAALAASRCAPVQWMAYGHPATAGLSSIDGYLTGEWLDPTGNEIHYRETLIRLPLTGACLQQPPVINQSLGVWMRELRDAGPVALCLQNLRKLQPEFDAVLADILQRSKARLAFFDLGKGLRQRFENRFRRHLSQHGVDFDERVMFLPAMDYDTYLAGLAEADLVLDTPGFSGGATSIDTIHTGTPVVCFDQGPGRARQTAAMLKTIGVAEGIASNSEEYVEKALRYLSDVSVRVAYREQLRANAAKLFDHAPVLNALEQAIEKAVRG